MNTDTRASTEIALTTAEGDRVTLSATSLSQAAYASYDYRGRLQGEAVDLHAETVQLSSQSGITITVEGDLSEEELADIHRLINTVEGIAREFFSGDQEGALRQALHIEDFDSIARFEADLQYSRSVTVGHIYEGDGRMKELSSAPAPKELKHLFKRIRKAIEHSGVEKEKAAKVMRKFIPKLLKKLADHYSEDADKRKPAEKMTAKWHRFAGHNLSPLFSDLFASSLHRGED
ncbi:MAG: hypothetical protein D6736_10070 [Nitrospinota bacterium]|nr:MAG: hypothetical protein D6736_10070 [Nitrospinota bacterium]